MSKRRLLDALAADLCDLERGDNRKLVKWMADPPTCRQFKTLCDKGKVIKGWGSL